MAQSIRARLASNTSISQIAQLSSQLGLSSTHAEVKHVSDVEYYMEKVPY